MACVRPFAAHSQFGATAFLCSVSRLGLSPDSDPIKGMPVLGEANERMSHRASNDEQGDEWKARLEARALRLTSSIPDAFRQSPEQRARDSTLSSVVAAIATDCISTGSRHIFHECRQDVSDVCRVSQREHCREREEKRTAWRKATRDICQYFALPVKLSRSPLAPSQKPPRERQPKLPVQRTRRLPLQLASTWLVLHSMHCHENNSRQLIFKRPSLRPVPPSYCR